MGLKFIRILGISITKNKKEEILEYIQKYLEEAIRDKRKAIRKVRNPLIIVTPNPEQIVYAQGNPRFMEVLNQADVAIPDGVGLLWASRLIQNSELRIQNGTIQKRIPGIEFMEDLVKIAADKGYSIGLIGGRGGVAVKALECLQSKYPGLNGWAEEGPELEVTENGLRIMYYGNTNSSFLRSVHHNTSTIIPSTENTEEFFQKIAYRIQKTDTRFVFVGLGAPKQEYFIEKLVRYSLLVHRKTRNVHNDQQTNKLTNHSLVLMAVGGSFDIIAGKTPRAPLILRTIGVEWLWRLFKEPWRFVRQLRLVKFVWLLVLEKLK